MFFRDPFKLVPVNNIAEIADKFTRNEILTSNEIRQIIGFKPSDDPKADQLINSNITQPNQGMEMLGEDPYAEEPYGDEVSYEEESEDSVPLGQRPYSEIAKEFNEGG